jgi:hypothetical protein
MKKLLLPLLACGMFVSAFAQNEPQEPCCSIIARDIKNNLVVARNNTTGRLTCFKTDNLDIKAISKGDAVTINPQSKKITAISGAVRNYNIIQPDKAEPVGILAAMRIDNAEPLGKTQVDKAGPINSIVTPKINNAEPSCAIVSIEPDPSEPCCKVVSLKNNSTGVLSKFNLPKNIGNTIKVGDPVYVEPINGMRINMQVEGAAPISDFAIVQSSYGNSNGQMASYGYPATSGNGTSGNANATAKWVITPVTNMKGVLGQLDMNFPPGLGWVGNLAITRQADNKYITSFSGDALRTEKKYSISPDQYLIHLNNLPVENVPIQKGHVTRLKAGFLNVVSEGTWQIYNESKEKQLTSYNKPMKFVMPVGNYQLSIGGQFYPVTIKDGKTVEY